MIRRHKAKLIAALAILAIPSLAGCGSSSSSSAAPGYTGITGSIVGGQAAINFYGNTVLQFTASSIWYGNGDLFGGLLPPDPSTVIYPQGGAFGSMGFTLVSNTVTQIPTTGIGTTAVTLEGQNYSGDAIMANLSPNGATTSVMGVGTGDANGTGYIEISALEAAGIYNFVLSNPTLFNIANSAFYTQVGSGSLMPTGMTTPNIFISGVALELQVVGSELYDGDIYLYLNGTQHGYKVPF